MSEEAQLVTLPAVTMNKVLNLLGSMPFNQVVELIQEIRENVKVVQMTPPEDSE